MDILGFFKGTKAQGLHFGDDNVIRNINNLVHIQGYQFDKKKDRAWPLIHKTLLATKGGFPYLSLMTDYGVLDPFNVLTDEEKKTVGDGKAIAKSSIRDVMHKAQKQSANHTIALMLGFTVAAVFIIVLILVLLFVKGKLTGGLQ